MSHSQYRGTHGESGRASAGARPATRTIDRTEVLARRAQLLAQPPSPERSRDLTIIRRQLTSIDRRVEDTCPAR